MAADDQQPLPPREEFTDITVQSDGRWFTKDRLIQNKDILAYFKSNLKRDEKGIYILNVYGKFSEKGYIKVFGPVLEVASLEGDVLTLETGDKFTAGESQFIIDSKERLYAFEPGLATWVGFSKNAMMQLAENLVETPAGFEIYGQAVKKVDSLTYATYE